MFVVNGNAVIVTGGVILLSLLFFVCVCVYVCVCVCVHEPV